MTPQSLPQGVDAITLEVVRNKLQGIADEMQLTQVNASFSTAVKEAFDAAASLYLPDGTPLAQSASIPFHVGNMVPAVRRILQDYPAGQMREGDIYLMNDPYHGGSHMPDIILCLPAFHEGRLIALSCTVVHHNDVGGMTPGSLPPNATEIFQEGLRIPPMIYRRDGQMNETLHRLMLLNSRTPETLEGDLNSQIGACAIGVRRVQAMAADYGHNALAALFSAIIDRSEVMTRAELKRIPAGVYRFTDWLDNDGVELDRRVKIEVAVTVGDGDIHFDFSGTSPQTKGPINAVPSAAHAAAYYVVRVLTDSTIPNNGGCFRPISLTLPEGSLVNPQAPAAVNARTGTTKRIANAMLSALAPAMPQEATAQVAGVTLVCRYSGRDDAGRPFVVGDHFVGGSGGWMGADGVDVLATDIGNTWGLPVESVELDAPLRVLTHAIRPDSGGAGTHRGGNGLIREFEVLCEAMTFMHRGERHYVPAQGLDGGGTGALEVSTVIRADGTTEEIPSKAVVQLRRGDRVRIETPGGGGWGPPEGREAAAIAADIAAGKLTAEAARRLYGHA